MLQTKKPLVSVVIPSYNHSNYICKTIETILSQTVTDIELIIIDDGSADNSARIIENYLRTYPDKTITFISRENRGICRTLNDGLKLSEGKYFCYIGSDDFWHPEKLERQIKALEAAGKNAAASYTDSYIIDSNDKILDRYGRIYAYHSGEIYTDLIWMNFQPPSPTNMFLRTAVLAVGGFNEKHFIEDKDLWVRIAKQYEVVYVDEPLAYYRVHETNTSMVYPEKMFNYLRQVVAEAVERDSSLAVSRFSIETRIMALQAGSYYEFLDLKKARRYSLKTFKRNPFNLMAWRSFIFSLLGKNTITYLRNKRRRQFQKKLNHLNNGKPELTASVS